MEKLLQVALNDDRTKTLNVCANVILNAFVWRLSQDTGTTRMSGMATSGL